MEADPLCRSERQEEHIGCGFSRRRALGGCGHGKERAREGTNRGGSEHEVSGGPRGATNDVQKQAASRRWPGPCARLRGTRPPAYWQEVEDDREEEVGWAASGPATWVAR